MKVLSHNTAVNFQAAYFISSGVLLAPLLEYHPSPFGTVKAGWLEPGLRDTACKPLFLFR